MNSTHTHLVATNAVAGQSTTDSTPATHWTPPALPGDVLESAPLQTTLTAAEQEELTQLEAVVKGEWASLLKVGAALKEIRDKRLYRDRFATFNEYCREVWEMSRTHADRQIGAAHVADVLTPIGVIVQNESVARPMVSLAEDQILTTYQDAQKLAGDKPVTAKHVRQAAAKFKPAKAVKPKAKAATDASIDFGPAFALLDIIEQAALRRRNESLCKKVKALRVCLNGLAVASAAPYHREGAAQ
jgi:hypothetical protein